MIRRRLPPLNALRAFESAARHLSVKSAAAELCVTPGAVSQMLRNLEADIGVKLFERVNRGIRLTPAGREYLPPIRNAFRQIAEASKKVKRLGDGGILTVSTSPFFASAWLVPRMNSFQAVHPDIDLRILTSNAPVDFSQDGVDVAVRHGGGSYPGLRSYLAVSVEMVAVAAPSLVDRLGMPTHMNELTFWPHVHDADRAGWSLWFRAQGIEQFDVPKGASFDDAGLLLGAAFEGHGAALLPDAMVAPHVDAGRLVRLSRPSPMETFAYYLVYPNESHDDARISAFRTWLLSMAFNEVDARQTAAMVPSGQR
jgi:LysR family transcriptional regulator, glycine cleavage system transcriptional activator